MTQAVATAYGPPWNAMEGGGVTSTGVNLHSGKQLPIVAVDPSVIPYGSIVRIDNSPFGRNKLFVAGDTGGAIKGQRFDFFVASGRTAQNGWGRQGVNYQIVQRGNGPGSVQGALNKVLSGQSFGGSNALSGGSGGGGQQSSASQTTTTTSGGQPDIGSAIVAALLQGGEKPISASGKFSASGGLLSKAMANIDSGNYNTPVVTTKTVTGGSGAQSQPNSFGHFAGYVNPIHGAIIGRTDMGLDASGLPNGHPIIAPGDSRVVGISPNWYKGQPYVAFQFTDGPQKGKYYYIAEAINPTVHSGQIVRAGQTVGLYNSGGTGLEMGWGTPTPGRTLAQATSGYSEGQATPAGIDFTRFFKSLR